MRLTIKMRRICLPFICLSLLLGKLSAGGSNSEESKLVEAINGFGIGLYKEIVKRNDSNVIFSGFSMDTLMNMILAGSRTSSEAELRNALGYETVGLSNTEVTCSYRHLLTKHLGSKKGYELDVANGIWIDNKIRVSPNFKKIIKKFYLGEEHGVSFGTQTATDAINRWVSNQTKGKIPKLFDETLDSSTVLVLANAIYFKGTWQFKFDVAKTNRGKFTGKGGKRKTMIPMMNGKFELLYGDCPELNAKVLQLPYDGKQVAMYVILPDRIDGLASLEQKLTAANVKKAIESVTMQEVNVKLPKFKASSNFDMIPVLKKFGVEEIFAGSADLSGISQTPLHVSEVVQKAIIEVSEEGTVAAAVSAGAVALKSAFLEVPLEVNFIADHPFLYFIVHVPTGMHLFTGRYAKP